MAIKTEHSNSHSVGKASLRFDPSCDRQATVAKILAIRESHPGNLMAQGFDPAYFASLSSDMQTRLLQCCHSGVMMADSSMGCYAMRPDDYDTFFPFFQYVISHYHKISMDSLPPATPASERWALTEELDFSAHGLPPLSMRVRVGRNLNAFALPGSMSRADRVAMEGVLGAAFQKLIDRGGEFGGRYVSLTPGHANCITAQEYDQLVKDHIMFKDMSNDEYLEAAGIASEWPYGRGCYISADQGFLVWVGEEDHLRIMCMQVGTRLNALWSRLSAALGVIEAEVPGGFAMHANFGVVTSCPTNCGTGMRASVHVKLPGCSLEELKALAKPLGLSVRGLGGEHTPIGADGTVDISPSARFGISEVQIAGRLYAGIGSLLSAHAALMAQKSAAVSAPVAAVEHGHGDGHGGVDGEGKA